MRSEGPSTGAVLRVALVIVALAALLYLVFLLRRPLGWLVIAAFVAIALSGPVNLLARRMPRSAAIAAVYAAVVAVPIVLGALILPRLVEQAAALASDAPGWVRDAQETLRGTELFGRIDEQFDVGDRLRELVEGLPARLDDAAAVLSSIGLGIVDSLFALFTILVLSAFMVASGPRWVRSAIGLLPEGHRERTDRALRAIAVAVAGYVRAQMTIALIAAVAGYLVMTLLGIPFREPLAVLIALASLIPVIGAPLWGVAVGLVSLTVNFPTTTILWVIWAVVYPQIENYVLQPQLQKRAVQVEPFVIIVAVLFGGTLLGIVGALLAIPAPEAGPREGVAPERPPRAAPRASATTPAARSGSRPRRGWPAAPR